MEKKIVHVEKRALLLGVVANFVMALSGWLAYNLSGSEALLLDGNVSFILFITALVALKINAVKSLRSSAFPFGLYVTEALYSLMKGLLLLGVVISAIVGNSSKIISFIQGNELPLIKTGVIVYYAIAMVAICWGLSLFYHLQNKKIDNSSSMLTVDQKSSFIDGVLSAATGGILIAIGFIDPDSSFSFLLYIGDALLVLILALIMVSQPITIIKDAFVELVGGRLQNEQQHADIEKKVRAKLAMKGQEIVSLYISKTGSSYLIVVGMDAKKLGDSDARWLVDEKTQLLEDLKHHYPIVDLELVLA